ncbi:ABC transporter ATP-binding protein [Nakamurella sp. PAMC28650]|uniref:dipeptide ABC transporter ATP-binding protein n=1 Tax=Nakamurella sp. PAMC28650 TaxID=2762325 RepID=UPI00164E06FF|nr:ABC transporter ATP-binding protein [Nakamurella sp. PAMC28650]QNK79246.1 ABC transporter ATP-binding protein [Nakamurella sp. PAMC28650]
MNPPANEPHHSITLTRPEADRQEPVLTISGLSVDYQGEFGDTHAVVDVDLTLHRGEILGLAGESGCGKSTIAYAINRLTRPPALITSGSVVLHEKDGTTTDVLALSGEPLRLFRWKKMAMVFQGAMNALNPVLSIRAQLEDVLAAHQPEMSGRQRADRCTELMRTVNVDPSRLSSFPHELSGGMRQRVMIAMALALQPDVLIMDEPTTALDVVVQREILREVLRLRDEYGFAVIFITHDLALLLEISDRIAVMLRGQIVELAAAQDLYRRPQHAYTRKLLGSFPSLTGPRRDYSRAGGTGFAQRNTADSALVVSHLSKEFRIRHGRLVAVDDVSFELTSGRTVALVGESGSGKSTLARMLSQLERPTSGEITLNGEPIGRRGKALRNYRNQVQMVFQDPFASLNPFHTVEHHLLRPIRVHGIVKGIAAEREEIRRLLTRVNLTPVDEIMRKRPHELSGGQRQRVAIARALASRPSVLLADEPVSMLDVSIRLEVLGLLDTLKQEDNLAVLYITHDLATARHFSSEILVLYRGRIVERGPSDDVILNPQHEYTRTLLAAAPDPSQRIDSSH